jgi:collagen type V/XI/XXIV/XXVII alpha
VFKALEEVTLQIEKIRNPTGERDSPARTCENLRLHNPDIKDG